MKVGIYIVRILYLFLVKMKKKERTKSISHQFRSSIDAFRDSCMPAATFFPRHSLFIRFGWTAVHVRSMSKQNEEMRNMLSQIYFINTDQKKGQLKKNSPTQTSTDKHRSKSKPKNEKMWNKESENKWGWRKTEIRWNVVREKNEENGGHRFVLVECVVLSHSLLSESSLFFFFFRLSFDIISLSLSIVHYCTLGSVSSFSIQVFIISSIYCVSFGFRSNCCLVALFFSFCLFLCLVCSKRFSLGFFSSFFFSLSILFYIVRLS